MVLAVERAPETLNPLAGYAPYGAAKIFDGLVEHTADGGLRPALASDLPRPSQDGLTWTVRLRDGVRFSDGTTFGAADVLATYQALLDPAVDSPLRPKYDMLTGVSKVDEHTVRFRLSRRDPDFAHLLVLGILPSEALADPGPAAESPIGTDPVGTGPYRVRSFRPGEKLVLAANRSYFAGKPAVSTVTVLLGRDGSKRSAAVARGTVDGACLPAATVARHGVPDGYRTLTDPAADTLAVTLPTDDPVTGNTAIRTALNLVVNRKAAVSRVLANKGSVASTPVTDAHPELQEPDASFGHHPKKARSVLRDAGWTAPGDGDTRSHGDTRAAFPVLYAKGDTVARGMVRRLASDAAKAGIDVEPKPASRDELAERAGEEPELVRTGSPFDPVFTLSQLLHSGGSANDTGYHDAAVATALERARTVADPAQRAVAMRAMQRAYREDPAMVVLARADHVCLQRAAWTGYQPVTDPPVAGIAWGPWWNLATWSPQ